MATPTRRRRKQIKSQGTQIILTNPDSLHHAMLPGHRAWGKKFWGSLRYIVLDEAHTHTGVSGSHVANVLRRLLRVCASWDPTTRPEFICTSATISNPVQHIRRLTTRTPVCVDISGAPSGEKAMILWQPPESEEPAGRARRRGFSNQIVRVSRVRMLRARNVSVARPMPKPQISLPI